MQLIAMAAVNLLFLAIVLIGVLLERRISGLEQSRKAARRREEEFCAEARERLCELEKRVFDLENIKDRHTEKNDKEAEKRFSQGVENILNYALKLPTIKEAEHDNT